MFRSWLKKKGLPRHSRRGFTLAEMAIALTVAGVLGGTFIPGLLLYLRAAHVQELKTEIAQIDRALRAFHEAYGRYPCAASRTLPATDPNFGREVSCTAAAAAPATVSNGGVRIGAVPIAALDLETNYAFDPWERQYTYAVTETLATDFGYVSDGGKVAIVDSIGSSIIEPPGTAHYIIVSHGADQNGGYNRSANAAPCPGGTLDAANCDDNNIFRKTDVGDEEPGANHYDDYSFHRGHAKLQMIQSLPSGAIMATKNAVCPAGWQNLTADPPNPAPVPDLRGRMIIGMGDFTDTYSFPYPFFPNASRIAWVYNKTYAFQETGGYATYVMDMTELPPHAHLSEAPTVAPAPPSRGGDFMEQTNYTGTILGGPGAAYGFMDPASNPNPGTDQFEWADAGGASCSPPPPPIICTGQMENRPPFVALTLCEKN